VSPIANSQNPKQLLSFFYPPIHDRLTFRSRCKKMRHDDFITDCEARMQCVVYSAAGVLSPAFWLEIENERNVNKRSLERSCRGEGPILAAMSVVRRRSFGVVRNFCMCSFSSI